MPSSKNNLEPALIAIFGATGDLSHRMLLPALYEMSAAKQLPSGTIILGIGREHKTDADFRNEVQKSIEEFLSKTSEEAGRWCNDCIYYFGAGKSTDSDFEKLRASIEQLEQKNKLPGNRVMYLALPPIAFEPTIESLGKTGLNESKGWTRLVIEKPFGHDLESAEHLDSIIHKHFEEEQVYRIDHYLGKETVQNLLAFRFGNAIFESVWNRDRIEKVEIIVAEELGIGSRANYYEKAGALRDMVQNHLTQLLTLTAMEIPCAFTANDIRYEKVKVLKAIAPIEDDDVVYGQYGGRKVDGDTVAGYLKEQGVSPDSKTPTFVALKLRIKNWRWEGVPFYLKTGKRLEKRISEIKVTFKCPPVSFFVPSDKDPVGPNVLIIQLQPNEGFRISFEVKEPGSEMMLRTEWMHFDYAEAFGELPDAYHTLLLDILKGDQTLFVSADESLSSWRLYTPVLEREHKVYSYPSDSWGPKEADSL